MFHYQPQDGLMAALPAGVPQGPELLTEALAGLETALSGTLEATAGPTWTVGTGSPIPPP